MWPNFSQDDEKQIAAKLVFLKGIFSTIAITIFPTISSQATLISIHQCRKKTPGDENFQLLRHG